MLTEERPELSAPHLAERRRMLVQLEALNTALLGHDSATAVLQSICDRRDPDSPRIRARKVAVKGDCPEIQAIRRQLGASDDRPLRHRRVELMCGQTVLCRAENWYLPDRLTDEMNAQLLDSETPFGVVVSALGFQRRTLTWQLLLEPEAVLQHRAMLQTPDGHPFSLLLETYTKQIIMS